MQKTILAYNFTSERLQMLKVLAMMLRVQLRFIEHQQMLQPIGYFAGVQGVDEVTEIYSGDEAQQEMLILCGFTRPDLDRLLSAVKKSKLKQISLKAMLTPTNCKWTGLKLQQELLQEHAYMSGNKLPKPKHKV